MCSKHTWLHYFSYSTLKVTVIQSLDQPWLFSFAVMPTYSAVKKEKKQKHIAQEIINIGIHSDNKGTGKTHLPPCKRRTVSPYLYAGCMQQLPVVQRQLLFVQSVSVVSGDESSSLDTLLAASHTAQTHIPISYMESNTQKSLH